MNDECNCLRLIGLRYSSYYIWISLLAYPVNWINFTEFTIFAIIFEWNNEHNKMCSFQFSILFSMRASRVFPDKNHFCRWAASIPFEPFSIPFSFDVAVLLATRRRMGFSCVCKQKTKNVHIVVQTLPCPSHEIDEPKTIWQSYDIQSTIFTCIVSRLARSSHIQFYFSSLAAAAAAATATAASATNQKPYRQILRYNNSFSSRHRWFTIKRIARFDC